MTKHELHKKPVESLLVAAELQLKQPKEVEAQERGCPTEWAEVPDEEGFQHESILKSSEKFPNLKEPDEGFPHESILKSSEKFPNLKEPYQKPEKSLLVNEELQLKQPKEVEAQERGFPTVWTEVPWKQPPERRQPKEFEGLRLFMEEDAKEQPKVELAVLQLKQPNKDEEQKRESPAAHELARNGRIQQPPDRTAGTKALMETVKERDIYWSEEGELEQATEWPKLEKPLPFPTKLEDRLVPESDENTVEPPKPPPRVWEAVEPEENPLLLSTEEEEIERKSPAFIQTKPPIPSTRIRGALEPEGSPFQLFKEQEPIERQSPVFFIQTEPPKGPPKIRGALEEEGSPLLSKEEEAIECESPALIQTESPKPTPNIKESLEPEGSPRLLSTEERVIQRQSPAFIQTEPPKPMPRINWATEPEGSPLPLSMVEEEIEREIPALNQTEPPKLPPKIRQVLEQEGLPLILSMEEDVIECERDVLIQTEPPTQPPKIREIMDPEGSPLEPSPGEETIDPHLPSSEIAIELECPAFIQTELQPYSDLRTPEQQKATPRQIPEFEETTVDQEGRTNEPLAPHEAQEEIERPSDEVPHKTSEIPKPMNIREQELQLYPPKETDEENEPSTSPPLDHDIKNIEEEFSGDEGEASGAEMDMCVKVTKLRRHRFHCRHWGRRPTFPVPPSTLFASSAFVFSIMVLVFHFIKRKKPN